MPTHHDIDEEQLLAIVNGNRGLNEQTARTLLLTAENVKRLVRYIEGNGVRGLLDRQTATEKDLALIRQKQADCPAAKRNWLGIIGILLAAGSAVVSTAITLYTVVSNAPHP